MTQKRQPPLWRITQRAAVLLLLGLTGCASLPPTLAARGLYVDLRKAVEYQESSAWVVDRLEVEEVRAEVMASVCGTSQNAQEDLRAWLNAQIDADLGQGASSHEVPSEIAYEAEGDVNGRVRDLQHLERVRMLLDSAAAEAADCPYWTHPDAEFAGVESDEARFVLLAESVGSGSLRVQEGTAGFGGGGGGRLFLAYGFRHVTLGLGFELGAAGSLPETEDGGRTFEAVLSSGVPLLLRFTNITRVIDIELSYRTIWSATPRHGGRIGIGYGITTPRVETLMPYGLLWIGYELFPAQNGDPMEHGFLIGTRVGFDWDP